MITSVKQAVGRTGAFRIAVRLITVTTRSPRWLWRLGLGHERDGRIDAAIAAYQSVIGTVDVSMPQYLRVASLHRQRGEADAARRLLQLALDRASDQAEYYTRLVRIRSHEADWAGVVDAYREALEFHGDRADWLVGLAQALERAGHIEQSVDAYERAIGCATRETPTLRYELARVYDRLGLWARAASVLAENLDVHPAHAASHRLFAIVSEKAWRWNGQFEQSVDGSQLRFRPLPTLALVEPWPSANADDVHAAARRAMASALSLAGDRPAWLVDLGRMAASAGQHDDARTSFSRAFELARRNVSRRIQVSIHPAQFGLELAWHRCGQPRVSDSLFDVDVVAHGDLGSVVAGVFDARAEFDGLRISGLLTDASTERVGIWLDDSLIRLVNVTDESYLASFQFRIRRSTLREFPVHSVLSVRTPDGVELAARGRGSALGLTVPGGTGALVDAIRSGRVIDKKGVLAPDEQELHQLQDEFLKLYSEVREFLEREFGKQLLLFYGNLLGLYRDGGFIPGDDDFDVGYVSDEADPESVKAEATRVIMALMRAGFTVSVNRKGVLFRVQRDDGRVHLSVRQAWFSNGKVWILRYANFPAGRDDFLPAEEALLRGTTVLIPAHPEVFLTGHYGAGWRFPDPGFRYYASNVSTPALNYLQTARMSPAEFSELQAAMSAERQLNPAVGRLVALGSQSLYPLDLFVE